MTERKQNTPPPAYAIWVEGQPDGPLEGRSGFLSEQGRYLFYTTREKAEQKIKDMRNLRLNRHPAAEYQCVEYASGHDMSKSIKAEQIKGLDLRPDPGPMRYEILNRVYGNTGGGCMVGTVAAWLPELSKTIWISCNDEGVAITSADYLWNEDHSGSWDRYEDVVMREVSFWADQPEDLGQLRPIVQDAISYTISQEVAHENREFRIPARWLPEPYRLAMDPNCLRWALEEDREVTITRDGILPDDLWLQETQSLDHWESSPVVYIASPLAGDVEENLELARDACRYAIGQGVTPFAPHLLYPQLLDDGVPEDRQLGMELGHRMLRLCDELWLCGDQLSPGMAEERDLAKQLGIPVRSVGMEEILSASPAQTEGMEMTMG